MFVAVWPDEAVRESLSSLDLGPTGDLRLVDPAQWHVTLHFLGDVPDETVPELVCSLEKAGDLVSGPVECHVGPGTSWFGRDRVLQIPVHGLDPLAAAVRAAAAAAVPSPPADQTFSGHLTLARPRGRRLTPAVRDAVAGIPFSARFAVDRFDLVSSEPTPRGHLYSTLARLPLSTVIDR